MKKLVSGLNVNSIIIVLFSGALCIMQGWVLEAVRKLPAIEVQIGNFQNELNLLRDQLKREEEERKAADLEGRQRMKLLEDAQARRP